MIDRPSRRDFLKTALVTTAASLFAVRAASSHFGEDSKDILEDDLWGTYRMGRAGIGEIQGVRTANIEDKLRDKILDTAKDIGIGSPKLVVPEIIGDNRNVLTPLVWDLKNKKVSDRWSVWSFDKNKELVPIESDNSKDIFFVQMYKNTYDGSPVIGPTRFTSTEPFISFVQNWGWQINLPYRDIDPRQTMVPLNNIQRDLQEFLTG